MQIGLIGGIGPAATDFYYQRLIRVFAQKKSPLELTIVHADRPTLLENLTQNRAATQAQIFARLTDRLASAGAGCVAITSIAGHFCRKEFGALSPLPVVDMIDEVGRAVTARGVRRIGILGTRTVMEFRFYGGVPTATVLLPVGTLDFSRAISSSRSSRSRSFNAVTAPASARSRHAVSLATETFVCRATRSSGSPRNNRATIAILR